MQPQIHTSIGGFVGAAAGALLTLFLIDVGFVVALETCDTVPNANLQLLEFEDGKWCGYSWPAILGAGFLPVTLCSYLGVYLAGRFQAAH